MLNIYVGNLSFDAEESQVHDLFAQYGEVERVSLITDRETGRPRGFGFVEMRNEQEGRAAIEALNGTDFNGRQLTVNEARPRNTGGGGGGERRGSGGRRARW